MKLIEPKFEIIEQAPGIEGMLKQIEIAGRTCYKSHDKITEDSAEKFVERMKSLGHGSVLEHATVYLLIDSDYEEFAIIQKFTRNQYSKVKYKEINDKPCCLITTNYRVLIQGNYKKWSTAQKYGFNKNWLDVLRYQCEPTKYHEKRVTVRFNTDIGISREFNRHRVNSISEESTRYCNYSKGKFGGEISVVPPIRARRDAEERLNTRLRWYDNENKYLSSISFGVSRIARGGIDEKNYDDFDAVETYLFAILSAQWAYMRLTQKFGWSAQEARSILPLCTATELVHTAFVSDWMHFFKLRCDSHAHPMAQELAIPLKEEFTKRGLTKKY